MYGIELDLQAMSDEIKSVPFRLDPDRYARVYYKMALKKRWSFLLVLWFLFGELANYGITSFFPDILAHIGFLAGFLLYPLMLYSALRQSLKKLKSPENKLLFIERTFEISPNKIIAELDDGSRSVLNLERRAEFTLLYFMAKQAFFVPDGIWASPEDEAKFKEFVNAPR